ncbi:MAG TPA: ABC transporter permease [Propionibacteriaceae bacterium]|nr:ABC transporter permease [Propionibacteriaceae bacterium]HPZ50569.1 ABC transporter permease [Propionibacteriaceae bacterium]
MLSFIGKRLLSGVGALFVVACLTFILLYLSSGNIARNIMGDQASDAAVAAKARELGLDQPLLVRLGSWLLDAVRLEFGKSWFTNQPVFQAIGARLPLTLIMVVIAIVLIAIVSTLLGVVAAVKRGAADRVVQVMAVLAASIPGFIIGIVLVLAFAIRLRWFPAVSRISPTSKAAEWAASLTLPIIALVLNGIASSAQQIRSAFIKQLELDYVRTLRSRGIPEKEILFRHVLRAAAPAGLTVLSLQFIGLLGGVVIIESIFALPGMGRLAVDATTQSDLPVVMGVVIYSVAIVVVVNLLVDIANGWLNPKVRVS